MPNTINRYHAQNRFAKAWVAHRTTKKLGLLRDLKGSWVVQGSFWPDSGKLTVHYGEGPSILESWIIQVKHHEGLPRVPLPGCSALQLVLAALGFMKAGPQDQQPPFIPDLHPQSLSSSNR